MSDTKPGFLKGLSDEQLITLPSLSAIKKNRANLAEVVGQ